MDVRTKNLLTALMLGIIVVVIYVFAVMKALSQ